MPLDIIILALIAGFILLRLRAELGNKTGNEPLPPAAGRGPILNGESQDVTTDNTSVVDLEGDPKLRAVFQEIRSADPSFDPAMFRENARNAYGMILEAFWSGDRETLENLLDTSVFEQFSAALDDRENKGLQLENKLLDITEAEIVKGYIKGKVAELTVKFTSEVVAVTRGVDGDIVDGDPTDASTLHDKWTFARNVSTENPMWLLIATRTGE